MKLSEVKNQLENLDTLLFQLPDGKLVPEHFHVTEVGFIDKKFIDCGGTVRHEQKASFQLWSSYDYNHRLHPEKLVNIIDISQKAVDLPDLDVEVEYQGDTIGKYDLEFNNGKFHLTNKFTDCLAKDNCEIPKVKVDLSAMTANVCEPGSGCC